MNSKWTTVAAVCVALFLTVGPGAGAQQPVLQDEQTQQASPASNASAEATYRDIQKTLGVVPEFLRAYPPEAIAGAWAEMKNIELNDKTALSNKAKELIGVAVSAQIPCDYCAYFHTKAAKQNGATDREIKEAIAIGALTRHWSTYFNGLAQDQAAFRREVDRLMENIKKQEPEMGGTLGLRPGTATSAEVAYSEMQKTFGFVPSFMQSFPKEGVAGAWEALKNLEFSDATALPSNVKGLISLAVAAQVPCEYCVYWDTKSLRSSGAAERQINEAVAMAAITRHWSTVLNGNQIDPAGFRRETDQIMSYVQKQASGGQRTGG